VVEGRLTLFVLDIYGALSATQSSVDRIEMGMRDGELKLADRSITLLRFLRDQDNAELYNTDPAVEQSFDKKEVTSLGISMILVGLAMLALLLFFAFPYWN